MKAREALTAISRAEKIRSKRIKGMVAAPSREAPPCRAATPTAPEKGPDTDMDFMDRKPTLPHEYSDIPRLLSMLDMWLAGRGASAAPLNDIMWALYHAQNVATMRQHRDILARAVSVASTCPFLVARLVASKLIVQGSLPDRIFTEANVEELTDKFMGALEVSARAYSECGRDIVRQTVQNISIALRNMLVDAPEAGKGWSTQIVRYMKATRALDAECLAMLQTSAKLYCEWAVTFKHCAPPLIHKQVFTKIFDFTRHKDMFVRRHGFTALTGMACAPWFLEIPAWRDVMKTCFRELRMVDKTCLRNALSTICIVITHHDCSPIAQGIVEMDVVPCVTHLMMHQDQDVAMKALHLVQLFFKAFSGDPRIWRALIGKQSLTCGALVFLACTECRRVSHDAMQAIFQPLMDRRHDVIPAFTAHRDFVDVIHSGLLSNTPILEEGALLSLMFLLDAEWPSGKDAFRLALDEKKVTDVVEILMEHDASRISGKAQQVFDHHLDPDRKSDVSELDAEGSLADVSFASW